jgi:hypothetical protein
VSRKGEEEEGGEGGEGRRRRKGRGTEGCLESYGELKQRVNIGRRKEGEGGKKGKKGRNGKRWNLAITVFPSPFSLFVGPLFFVLSFLPSSIQV